MIDWLIDYLRFYVPLKNFPLIWRRHHCRWSAAKFRPMLGAQGLWAGRDLYRAISAVTRDHGFTVSLTCKNCSFAYNNRLCATSTVTRSFGFPVSLTFRNRSFAGNGDRIHADSWKIARAVKNKIKKKPMTPPNSIASYDLQGGHLIVYTLTVTQTGCRSLVVVLSLSKRKVVSSSPARAGRVKRKTFKTGSDCSFAKSTPWGSGLE
jgi:hypothetical protein